MKHVILFASIFFMLPQVLFSQDSIPDLNKGILKYVGATLGTKVNRGECWDLAYEALVQNEAIWDWEYEYGQLYDPEQQIVFPGDLIQFEGVRMEYKVDNMVVTETMEHHTAIVYSVIDQDAKIFELAHQNTNFSGRKVGLSNFDLNQVIRGRVMFYRPVSSND